MPSLLCCARSLAERPHDAREHHGVLFFIRNAIRNFNRTASLTPSSRWLCRAMVEPHRRDESLRVVVEFGPGTGVITRELLSVLPPDGLLLAFELSPKFAEHLRTTVRDPRLVVLESGAQTAAQELQRRGIDSLDGVVCSIPIGMLSTALTDEIYCPLLPFLRNGAKLTHLQYSHRMRLYKGHLEFFDAKIFMQRYFRAVRSKFVPLNVPPAFVVICSGARDVDLRCGARSTRVS